MENRVSYILIGIFVFTLLSAAVIFIVWLGKYSGHDAYKFYKVVTKESVSGLNPQAPVKLRGVHVGEVQDIFIDKNNQEQVVAVIRVKEGTPITKDTYALIEPQGITGLSYIQLEGGSNESDMLKTGWKEKEYGKIPSKPSLFSRVDRTIQSIGEDTQRVLGQADKMMSDKNLHQLQTLLESLAKASGQLNTTLHMINSKEEDMDLVLKKAKIFEDSAIDAANKVQGMSTSVSKAVSETGVKTMDSVRQAAISVSGVMNKLDAKIEKGAFDFDRIIHTNLLPLNMAIKDLRGLILETNQLIKDLRDSPSDLLYKKTDLPLAPSEKERK